MYSDDTPVQRDKLQLMPSHLMQSTISQCGGLTIISELKSALWIQDTNRAARLQGCNYMVTRSSLLFQCENDVTIWDRDGVLRKCRGGQTLRFAFYRNILLVRRTDFQICMIVSLFLFLMLNLHTRLFFPESLISWYFPNPATEMSEPRCRQAGTVKETGPPQ